METAHPYWSPSHDVVDPSHQIRIKGEWYPIVMWRHASGQWILDQAIDGARCRVKISEADYRQLLADPSPVVMHHLL